jgi:4-amino-4-deoxy-L-arabinose transferase-like glycosyltransferase
MACMPWSKTGSTGETTASGPGTLSKGPVGLVLFTVFLGLYLGFRAPNPYPKNPEWLVR